MALEKRYDPGKSEAAIMARWQNQGTYHYHNDSDRRQFIIDTPPPTVSGNLHLGHVYSYTHADIIARFWRMNGREVLYPMGFDDNGLPTERLVEKLKGIRATEVGRRRFIEMCLEISEEAEKEYESLWKRLGLSIDWRFTYRTIDQSTRRMSQLSFIDLYNKGLAYRRRAPSIWCPECMTSIAQAELDDLERESEYVTVAFSTHSGDRLPIATTRPELLPACVAVFVHPDDDRYAKYVGQHAVVPLSGRLVPILADSAADPGKGTGAVMCCTFGDTTDVAWWHTYDLDLIEAVAPDGTMTHAAGELAGFSISDARSAIKENLGAQQLIISREPTVQSVRVHERCDTPVEYVVTSQWFVKALDYKDRLLEAGKAVKWYPPHMINRYTQWVENLAWDWCISRQRYFGVTFPLWYCDECGEIKMARNEDLPIDPTETMPNSLCSCGSVSFTPERDVMDTWATSSLTPQLVARWLGKSGFDDEEFSPVTLRPQAHEIIRTWAFYSILKAEFHFGTLPWTEAAISGWGLAPEGSGKISKSRGGGPVGPLEMIENYSADAVRYWAASTGLGKDAIINEERIQAGAKLVTKLWNIGRFSQRFLEKDTMPVGIERFSPADQWILASLQKLILRTTMLYENYDYATAKSEIEVFFWNEFADNYLEMAKKRLYDNREGITDGARFALLHVFHDLLMLFAPILPFVTEELYLELFSDGDMRNSIHIVSWPVYQKALDFPEGIRIGEALVAIATAVRKHKSENGLSLGAELERLRIKSNNKEHLGWLKQAQDDLASVTRAKEIEFGPHSDPYENGLQVADGIWVTIFT